MKVGLSPSIQWSVMAVLAVACLVLGYSIHTISRAEKRLGERYGEAYSARVLAEARLAYYIDLVDEKSAALAASAAAAGDMAGALSFCGDLCTLRSSLCDSLRGQGGYAESTKSRGPQRTVCTWLKTMAN